MLMRACSLFLVLAALAFADEVADEVGDVVADAVGDEVADTDADMDGASPQETQEKLLKEKQWELEELMQEFAEHAPSPDEIELATTIEMDIVSLEEKLQASKEPPAPEPTVEEPPKLDLAAAEPTVEVVEPPKVVEEMPLKVDELEAELLSLEAAPIVSPPETPALDAVPTVNTPETPPMLVLAAKGLPPRATTVEDEAAAQQASMEVEDEGAIMLGAVEGKKSEGELESWLTKMTDSPGSRKVKQVRVNDEEWELVKQTVKKARTKDPEEEMKKQMADMNSDDNQESWLTELERKDKRVRAVRKPRAKRVRKMMKGAQDGAKQMSLALLRVVPGLKVAKPESKAQLAFGAPVHDTKDAVKSQLSYPAAVPSHPLAHAPTSGPSSPLGSNAKPAEQTNPRLSLPQTRPSPLQKVKQNTKLLSKGLVLAQGKPAESSRWEKTKTAGRKAVKAGKFLGTLAAEWKLLDYLHDK